MGVLVNGEWSAGGEFPKDASGRFVRPDTAFRDWVTADGSAGPTGEGGFAAEAGRYHLYVSLACPWAHRTLIFRKLKGLEAMIGLSVVNWHLGDEGWTFADGPRRHPRSRARRAPSLRTLYRLAASLHRPRHRAGAVRQGARPDRQQRVGATSSACSIRRSTASARRRATITLRICAPRSTRSTRASIRPSTTASIAAASRGKQAAYEEAVVALFETLDALEARLAERRFLCGDRVTEADWRLFPTLVRFDPVYVGLFKCNVRRIADYPHLTRYLGELRAWPGIDETIDLFHIKHHYYGSLLFINPTGIVPLGPADPK